MERKEERYRERGSEVEREILNNSERQRERKRC